MPILQQKLRARMRKRLTEEFSRSAHGVDLGALADHIIRALKEHGFGKARVEGLPHCDWVLVDECEGGNAEQFSSWHGTHVAGTVAALTVR